MMSHAPRVGATDDPRECLRKLLVSIHTPAWGATAPVLFCWAQVAIVSGCANNAGVDPGGDPCAGYALGMNCKSWAWQRREPGGMTGQLGVRAGSGGSRAGPFCRAAQGASGLRAWPALRLSPSITIHDRQKRWRNHNRATSSCITGAGVTAVALPTNGRLA